jgi:hypothetical protein
VRNIFFAFALNIPEEPKPLLASMASANALDDPAAR